MKIHPKLQECGWNERVLTYADFEDFCERNGVLILDAVIRWPGFYTEYQGWPVIAIHQGLRGPLRQLVAWHEVGHYIYDVPGYFGWHAKAEQKAELVAHVATIPQPLLQRYTPDEIAEQYGYTKETIATRLAFYRRYKI